MDRLNTWLALSLAALYGLGSLLSFMLYGLDKQAARRGRRRVPEALLHWLALWGGWPGAWLAQQQFRHKTRKPAFRRLFWLSLVGNLSALTLLFLLNRS